MFARKLFGLCVVMSTWTLNAASAGPVVLDDRSQFVGDFTVIDFETRGDGSPLILDEGRFLVMPKDEYAAFGVTMTASLPNIFGDRPILGNGSGADWNAAQEAAGSPHNTLIDAAPEGFLRFDFGVPVNALGMATWTRTDGAPVRLEVFDSLGSLIAGVDFNELVIDGTILGADFGVENDFEYGFFGVFAPDTVISYAILTEGLTGIDDLHFGIIPEPGTLALLALGTLVAPRRRRKRAMRIVPLGVFLVAGGFVGIRAARAVDITGTVDAFVDTSAGTICGDLGWTGCVNPTLVKKALEGVKVCVDEAGGDCDFTGPNGGYMLSYTGTETGPLNIKAELDGEWVKSGLLDQSGPILLIIPTSASESFDPGAPGPIVVDITFNPNPVPVLEFLTAEVTAYYHAMLVRNFYLERQPDFAPDLGRIGLGPNSGTPCLSPNFLFTVPAELPILVFAPSGSNFSTTCSNLAQRSAVAHEFGHFLQFALGLAEDVAGGAFDEGFGDALSILVYDDPLMFPNQEGVGGGRTYDFEAGAPRREHPCAGDPHDCAEILAGLWWDIKLNLQEKYRGPPTCPIEGITDGNECGLELTRQLFTDWTSDTKADEIDGSIPTEVLQADDNDGDLSNSTRHYDEICSAFRAHSADKENGLLLCPFDVCGPTAGVRNQIHDSVDIAMCTTQNWCQDVNGNGIPDGCDKIVYVDVNAPTGNPENGLSWNHAYKRLRSAINANNPVIPEIPDFVDFWVADGLYTPDLPCSGRACSFPLRQNQRIFGGFAGGPGGEQLLDERDWINNVTILSGDIGAAGVDADNSYHVVTVAPGADFRSVLDGFTITAGNADGTEVGEDIAGGISVAQASPVIRNCRFVRNSAASGGGAISISSGNPTITNCFFAGNGALDGGAISNLDGSPTLSNCVFTGNDASGANGAGGAFQHVGGNPTFTNCTFNANTAFTGGGLFHDFGNTRVRNCVFWGNVPEAIKELDPSNVPTVRYSLVQEFWSGQGNLFGVDPLFVDPDGLDDIVGTEDDDVRLSDGSPAIDSGKNDFVTVFTDLDGNPRFRDDGCAVDCPQEGCGGAPVIDMGAYEHVPGPVPQLYVDFNAVGQNTGLSWLDAFTDLQAALGIAALPGCGVEEIWVARGTYRPDEGPSQTLGDQTASFELVDGVAILGGFTGSSLRCVGGSNDGQGCSDDNDCAGGACEFVVGLDADVRDIVANQTILSGDLGTPGVQNDNSYHVLTSNGPTAAAALDGFTIFAGFAFGFGSQEDQGGGLRVEEGGPTIRNCLFVHNRAESGGGIYSKNSTISLVNCAFSFNWTIGVPGRGGALYLEGGSATLTNCTVSFNFAAENGGGLYIASGGTTLTNCIVWGNEDDIAPTPATEMVTFRSPLKKWSPHDSDPVATCARATFLAHGDFFNGLLASFRRK